MDWIALIWLVLYLASAVLILVFYYSALFSLILLFFESLLNLLWRPRNPLFLLYITTIHSF
jgi:hypothetical protein